MIAHLRGKLLSKQPDRAVIEAAGVGYDVAITVLNGMSTEKMVAAIRGNDLASLTRISGIGKKTAERMVLELRDKLDQFAVSPKVAAASPVEEDVLSALVNLGYQRGAAEQAIKHAPSINGKSASFDALFRETLAALRK